MVLFVERVLKSQLVKFNLRCLVDLQIVKKKNDCFSGTIGHVAHGKSTVVKAISGVQVCMSVALLSQLFPFFQVILEKTNWQKEYYKKSL